MLPPRGRKAVQELLFAQGRESAASRPAEFLLPQKIGPAVNREAATSLLEILLLFFFAAKEFVALNGGNHADGAFFAGLGALYAAEAADTYGSGQSNLVRQGEKNLDGRAFLDILGKKEVDTAGADVP